MSSKSTVESHLREAAQAAGIATPTFGGFLDGADLPEKGKYTAFIEMEHCSVYLARPLCARLEDQELRAVLGHFVGLARLRTLNMILRHVLSGLRVAMIVLGILMVLGTISPEGYLCFVGFFFAWMALMKTVLHPLSVLSADRFSARLMGSGVPLAHALLKMAPATDETLRKSARIQRLLKS